MKSLPNHRSLELVTVDDKNDFMNCLITAATLRGNIDADSMPAVVKAWKENAPKISFRLDYLNLRPYESTERDILRLLNLPTTNFVERLKNKYADKTKVTWGRLRPAEQAVLRQTIDAAKTHRSIDARITELTLKIVHEDGLPDIECDELMKLNDELTEIVRLRMNC